MRATTRRHVARQEVERLRDVVARRSAKLKAYDGADRNYGDRLRGRTLRAGLLLEAAEERLAALPRPEEDA